MPNWEGMVSGPEKKHVDWEAAIQQYGNTGITQGGTYETVHGKAPGVPNLLDSPDPLGHKAAAIASTIEDPQAKLRFMAGTRYPDLPIHEAMDRYGYIDGDPVYVGDDGTLYREFPSLTEKAAGMLAGNAMQIIGGAAGGARFGAPGAAAGSMLGLASRKGVGAAYGDPRNLKGDAFDLGVEGALNAIGWKIGDLAGKKIIDRRVVKDIGKFDKTRTQELQRVAKEYFGVDLTPAETTELGSLINQQTKIGMGMDDAANTVRDFLKRRAAQVDDAVDAYIGTTPPRDVVGKKAREVMQQSIDDAKAARTTASSPIYKSTIKDDVLVPEKGVERLMEDDYIRSVFDKVSTDPRYGVLDAPQNSTSKIDAVKKAIDDEIGELKRSGKDNAVRILEQKKARLTTYTDRLYPSYKDARSAYASQSQYVDELEGGMEGVIANLKDPQLKDVTKKLLDPKNTSPLEVSQARRTFINQGKEKEWRDVTKQYLREIWEGPATRDVQSGANVKAGANFRKQVFGTKRQKEIMREALGPKEFGLFQDLMDVLEATGRVPHSQSITQSAQEYAKAEAREAAPVVSAVGDTLKLKLGQWWIDMKAGNWRSTLADVMTSPDAISELEKLRKLKQMSPNSKVVLDTVTTALTKAGVYGTASVARDEPNQMPKAMQAAPRTLSR